MRRALLVGMLLAGAFGSSGCEEQGTEIVFTVTSGYLAPEQINAADITVLGLAADMTPTSPDACRNSQTVRLGPDERVDDFPFTFAVRAGSACNDRVFFTVTLLKDGSDVVASSGWARFQPGQSVPVTINIPRNQTCATGEQFCGAACTDTLTDANNCGWCTNRCAAPYECARGWCSCPDPKSDCDGACVDLQVDPSNCGTCGHACAAGEACVLGVCTATCPADQTMCGGVCVDTRFDSAHCGSCETACAEGERCQNSVCSSCRPLHGGQCEPATHCGCSDSQRCDATGGVGYGSPEVCVEAGPVDVMGACDGGNLCARGLGCFPGVFGAITERGGPLPPGVCLPWCVIDDPASCGGDGGSCRRLKYQPTDGSPAYGVCLPYYSPEICNWVDDTGEGMVDEGIDMFYDQFNCGECFNQCGMEETCIGGACQPGCSWPFQDCGSGWCDVNTENDALHCGGCPNVCGPDQFCRGSECVPDCAMLSDFSLCPGPEMESICVDTASDPDSCGVYCCGCACGPDQACEYGSCTSSCSSGALCDRRCVKTGTDPHNCGACGTTCATGQQCDDNSCAACPDAPRLGGECYPPTGCGCAENEVCVLEETVPGGPLLEKCRPGYVGNTEFSSCQASVPTCERGLQCLPTDILRRPLMNRCARLCITSDECGNGTCVVETVGPLAALAPYGICRSVGSPCISEDSTACAGAGAICLTVAGPMAGLIPGGYCSFGCDESNPCPWGSRCVTFRFSFMPSACLATCHDVTDCRESEDYVCTDRLDGPPSVCFPAGLVP